MEHPLFYTLVSTAPDGTFKTVETSDLEEYKVLGVNDNPRSRDELHGQPILEGYYGPFFDGDSIRYETLEVYQSLS